ncbi:MAG: hypothetical protein JW929_05750 [Anaerolineales bacterium]|nr:hypothetical protein [Anaerolineales bacterium]
MPETRPHSMIEKTAEFLHQEYRTQHGLFEAQPAMLQRFFEAQAGFLAETILQKPSQIKFTLPDRVVVDPKSGKMETIPPEEREQMAGGLVDRLTRTDLTVVLRTRFKELEQHPIPGIAAAAGVMRFATCRHMISRLLPAGRSVNYVALHDEEIPSEPDPTLPDVGSAITEATDAIVEEGSAEAGRGAVQVPFVPYARRFFLPQWIAFDRDGKLLVGGPAEAEAAVASMQNFLQVLHTAVGLAAYFVADDEYRRKRYGMLGQLVNQGRALAVYQTGEIIQTIRRRAAAQDLNRGLSITLPYFDDQSLKLKAYPFEVIPAGRIMFVPAFVVRACQEEAVKIAQDTRLSVSTRNHILVELNQLEQTFQSAKK